MTFPATLRYTKDHEWLQLGDDDVAIVGITDFAQGELGDIVYVDINTEGQTLQAGTVFGSVEAVKTVSDLYLPVDGEILEVNNALNDAPELVNTDPYGDGWMIKLKVSDRAAVEALLDAEAYQQLTGA
jgi:glycine cleavage system H protein